MAIPPRAQSIGRDIRNALSAVITADGDSDTARKLATEAGNERMSVREATVLALANLASTGKWTDQEIDAGARLATTVGNAKLPGSLTNFVGECKLAMRPAVRDHSQHVYDVVVETWDAEAANKKAPQPLRRAFARRYHTFIRMVGAAKEGQINATTLTAGDVIAFAQANDPAKNAAKVLKQLQAIASQLEGIYSVFPLGELADTANTINGITESALREAMNAEQDEETAPTQRVQTKNEPSLPDTTVGEEIEGVSDILEDFSGMSIAA